MLSIDPASINMGWALFEASALVACGTVKADPKSPISVRCSELLEELDKEIKDYRPIDVILVELVRSGTGVRELPWAVGVALASADSPVTLEVPQKLWCKVQDTEYYKSDVMDAKYIAKFAFQLCDEDDDDEND